MVINKVDNAVQIGNHLVGLGNPIFIIAEIGLNHNQDLDMAMQLVDAAVAAGCSAAKFQTFRTEDVYVPGDLAGTYHLMGKDISIYDLHTKLEMPEDWIFKLKKYCDERNIVFFSAPIGKKATDLLDKYQCEAFKISSYECTNIPFVRYVASKQKPLVLSTGGASLGEIEKTVNCIQKENTPLLIMHCVTKYPAPYHCANLAVMKTLKYAFEVPVGFSDNGFIDDNGVLDYITIPVAAAMAGADLFEIHITMDRSLPGPDHGFATEPHELKELVQQMKSIRKEYNHGKKFNIQQSLLGSSAKRTLPEEKYVRDFAFKSIFAAKDLSKGEKITEQNICILRPGEHEHGIAPEYYDLIIEKAVVSEDIKRWAPITWDLLLS